MQWLTTTSFLRLGIEIQRIYKFTNSWPKLARYVPNLVRLLSFACVVNCQISKQQPAKDLHKVMESSPQALEQELSVKYSKVVEELIANSPTIVILGESGVGKSTLINAVFGSQKARVGNGKPITQDFDYYPSTSDSPVNLYDSKGFEFGDRERRSRIKKFLADKSKESVVGGVSKLVHAVWYVKDAEKSRWTAEDTKMAKELLCDLPLIVVLNKVDIATESQLTELEAQIRNSGIQNIRGVLHVAAAPTIGKGWCTMHGDEEVSINHKKKTWKCDVDGCTNKGKEDKSPQGMQQLVDGTTQLIPEATRMSFIVAQSASLEHKQIQAIGIVTTFSLLAYGIGWSPIPFSDAPLIVASQLGMAASLAALFGVESQAVIPIVIGETAVFACGLGAASALKFLPLVGTVISGVIDSTVAIIFTLVLGIVYT